MVPLGKSRQQKNMIEMALLFNFKVAIRYLLQAQMPIKSQCLLIAVKHAQPQAVVTQLAGQSQAS